MAGNEPPKEKNKKGESAVISSGRTKIEVDVQRYVIGGIIVTLFLGFVGGIISVEEMVRASNNERTDSYKSLIEKVTNQETEMKILKNCLLLTKGSNIKCFEN